MNDTVNNNTSQDSGVHTYTDWREERRKWRMERREARHRFPFHGMLGGSILVLLAYFYCSTRQDH